MLVINSFLCFNVFSQIKNFSHLMEAEKYLLIIFHWIVTAVLLTITSIYYKTKKKHIWMYETLLIITTIRNIEPWLDF